VLSVKEISIFKKYILLPFKKKWLVFSNKAISYISDIDPTQNAKNEYYDV